MIEKDLCFKIAGEAGQGINISSFTLAKAFTRKGYFVFLLTENPNSIKIEHTWCSLRVSPFPIACQRQGVDILVAFNRESVLRRQDEVVNGGYVLCDMEAIKLEDKDKIPHVNYLHIPFEIILKELNAPLLLKNIIAIGAVLGLIGYDINAMEDIIKEQFIKKGKELVDQNNNCLEAGFNYIKSNFKIVFKDKLAPAGDTARMFLTGNEALCAGAIKAGCKFIAAYPMTPASSILHFMASKEKEYNIIVKHTEDEIAAMNMAIGAGFTGVRAMTCTSGGGFCLMSEALGMAAQSETPVVVAIGQRPGPSTGQPTHTSQADLKFVINASQGEFPRVVIAPGDAQECFRETFNAFNIAEEFQLPVILLTDKYLAESYVTEDQFDLSDLKIRRGKLLNQDQLTGDPDYKRYVFSQDGISPRALPGQDNGMHVATSYEHDEYGFYQEDCLGVNKMIDKRFSKVIGLEHALKKPVIYGDISSSITLIGWGSSKAVILEAMRMLKEDKIETNFLHIVYVWPFPYESVLEIMKKAKVTFGIEGNKNGQLISLIKEHTGFDCRFKILKYDGQPFYPEDIYRRVKEAL